MAQDKYGIKIDWGNPNIQEDEYGVRTPKVIETANISDIVQASREERYTSPQIQSTELGTAQDIIESAQNKPLIWQNLPDDLKEQLAQDRTLFGKLRNREADPVTRTALRYLLSPATSATQGVISAGETAQETKKAFEEGDVGGGLLGSIATLVRGGFSVATPAVPMLRAFTTGSEIASDVVGEEAVETITSPVTTLTKPETLAGRSAAEIGDVVVQALLAKTGQSIYRKVIPVETKKGIRYKDQETGKFIKKEEADAKQNQETTQLYGDVQQSKRTAESTGQVPASESSQRILESRQAQEKIDYNANAIQEMLTRGKKPEDIAKVLNIPKEQVKRPTFNEALRQTDNYDVRKIANQTGKLPREVAKQFKDLEKQKLVTKVEKGYKPSDEFKILLDDAQKNPQKYDTSFNQLNSNPIGEITKGLSKAQTLIDDVFQKYVGNRIYKGLSRTVSKLVPEKLKEQVIENYGLPKQYVELKTEAKDAIGRFNDLAKEIADNLKYKSKGTKFTDAEQKRLAQIIKGGVTTNPLLKERATKAINEIKSLERLGKEVETLPIETYNSKLPRRRINELLTAKRKLEQKNNPKLQPKIDDIDRKIKSSFKHGGEGYFKRVYLSKEQSTRFSKYGYYKPTRLDLTSAIARKDIPFEVRKEMGEVLTASYPVAKSITLEGKDVSLGRFFEAINERPDWSSPVERQGFVKMPDSPKLGKLKGQYVEERIANDISDVIRLTSPEYIESFLRRVNSIWKATKTVMNPSTHFRNIYSNSIMLDFSGVPHLDQIRLFKPAIEAVLGRGEYADKFKASRLTQSTFNKAELGTYLDAIAENPREFLDLNLGEKITKIYGKATLVDTKVGDIMGKVYQAEESVGKAIKFISELEKGKSIKEARTEANKWLFDYGETSKAVNFLRNNPIIGSPFITWTAKAMPRIIETAITRPLSFWKYPLIFSALTEYSLKNLNLTDEEWGSIESELPERMVKGQWLLLPFRDEKGKMQMVDLSYILPYKDAYDLMESGWMLATQGETNTGDDLVEGVFGLLNAPVLTTITELKANKNTYTDQPIWNDVDSNTEKAQKVFDYMYKMYMPALAPEVPGLSQGGYAYHKMSSVLKGKEDYYGRTFTLAPAVSSSFFGIKTSPIEPEKNKERLTYKIQDRITELGRKRNRILRDRGISEDERITQSLEIDEQIDSLRAEKEGVGFTKPKETRQLERKIRRYQSALSRIRSPQRRQEIQRKIAELKIELNK